MVLTSSDGHRSGWYASYCNAFSFSTLLYSIHFPLNCTYQEIDDLSEALIRYTELYGITSLPDLHIGGCTLQHGVMTYPQDYSLKETPGKSVIIMIHNPY